jgi:hypothetical protein
MNDKGKLIRVGIGFEGGQAVAVRLSEPSVRELEQALGRDEWHDLETEDGTLRVRLSQVVYVHVESGSQRVGFGA